VYARVYVLVCVCAYMCEYVKNDFVF